MASKVLTKEESAAEVKRVQGDGDWAYVFGEEKGSSTTDVADGVGGVSLDPFTREDVVNVLCVKDTSDNDDKCYGEWEGWGVFQLKDGRFLYAAGSCDTTGWG